MMGKLREERIYENFHLLMKGDERAFLHTIWEHEDVLVVAINAASGCRDNNQHG